MRYPYIFLLCALCMTPVYADQAAYTVRATEIKQKPFSDAATVATLKEKASVTMLSRQGGWVNINSEAGEGWVKLLSLRSDVVAAKTGDSGLGSLLNVGRTGSSGITVATGVRGLSEEELKNAKPNPEEFKKLQGFAVDKNKAENFATSVKLKSQTLDYLPAKNPDKN